MQIFVVHQKRDGCELLANVSLSLFHVRKVYYTRYIVKIVIDALYSITNHLLRRLCIGFYLPALRIFLGQPPPNATRELQRKRAGFLMLLGTDVSTRRAAPSTFRTTSRRA